MKLERWQEIMKTLHKALELPPGQTSTFLERVCSDDPELRGEVEALVRADGCAGQFLSRPILGERPSAPASPKSAWGRFSPGTVLGGRYRIVHHLGSGGMGDVYRADDLTVGQPVALKLLPELEEKNEERRRRLIEEVKIARQISHPNVCRIYDVGETESHPHISMEYVDGEDLASLLRRIGRPTQEKALEIAQELARGLAAAHDCGILHCDLKPANVMIDGNGRVRITDFGVSRAAGSPSEPGRCGTPAYMAPELLAARERSPQADVYALGLVMYELFTGRRTFEAESAKELLRLHQGVSPRPPSRIVKTIEPDIERLILSCLEKDPRDRPASATAVSVALTTMRDADSPEAHGVEERAGEPRLAPGDSAESRHHRKLSVLAFGVLAIVATGATVLLYFLNRGPHGHSRIGSD